MVETWQYAKHAEVHQIRVTDTYNETRMRFTTGSERDWSEWVRHAYGDGPEDFRNRAECLDIIEFGGYRRLF